jgi:hypothetical protein
VGVRATSPEMFVRTRGMLLSMPDIVLPMQDMSSRFRVSMQRAREKLPRRVGWCVRTADSSSHTQDMLQCGVRMSESIPCMSLCIRVLFLRRREMSLDTRGTSLDMSDMSLDTRDMSLDTSVQARRFAF